MGLCIKAPLFGAPIAGDSACWDAYYADRADKRAAQVAQTQITGERPLDSLFGGFFGFLESGNQLAGQVFGQPAPPTSTTTPILIGGAVLLGIGLLVLGGDR